MLAPNCEVRALTGCSAWRLAATHLAALLRDDPALLFQLAKAYLEVRLLVTLAALPRCLHSSQILLLCWVESLQSLPLCHTTVPGFAAGRPRRHPAHVQPAACPAGAAGLAGFWLHGAGSITAGPTGTGNGGGRNGPAGVTAEQGWQARAPLAQTLRQAEAQRWLEEQRLDVAAATAMQEQRCAAAD